MKNKRKHWTPEEKATIVLEILREESTLAQIADKYGTTQPQLSKWKSEFIGNMSAMFNKKPDDSVKATRALEEEKEALEKKVGQLTMEMERLKKKTTTDLRNEEKNR